MVGKKVFSFNEFPLPAGGDEEFGCFRDRIGDFLKTYAVPQDDLVGKMRCWSVRLITENAFAPMFVLEQECQGKEIGCEECLNCGWSHHLLTKRWYHFVIPVEEEWFKTTLEADADCFKETNLMHGVIHLNGFGHLLSINGAETGSKALFGRDIMYLWDRICTSLGARKITVKDVSKKRSMDIRLLYGVGYGHNWFAKWGYKFGHGSFGVTEERYNKALAALGSLPLEQVVDDCGNTQSGNRLIKLMIDHYKYVSHTQLNTIRDFIQLMLSNKTKTIRSSSPASLHSFEATTKVPGQRKSDEKEVGSNWNPETVQDTINVLANILKSKNMVMSRSELRETANESIGDTGLIDHAISKINNHIWDGYVVKRTKDGIRRGYRFSVDTIVGDESTGELEPKPFGTDIYNDTALFYNWVLKDYPNASVKEQVETVLNTKYFLKDYSSVRDDENKRSYFCIWHPHSKGVDPPMEEIVVLPRNATYEELLMAAQDAIRNSFYGMDKFVVQGVSHLEEIRNFIFDNYEVSHFIGPDSKIFILGSNTSALKYESGETTPDVTCTCGATIADGETIRLCSGCGVKQHERCSGFAEAAVSQIFYCTKCDPAD